MKVFSALLGCAQLQRFTYFPDNTYVSVLARVLRKWIDMGGDSVKVAVFSKFAEINAKLNRTVERHQRPDPARVRNLANCYRVTVGEGVRADLRHSTRRLPQNAILHWLVFLDNITRFGKARRAGQFGIHVGEESQGEVEKPTHKGFVTEMPWRMQRLREYLRSDRTSWLCYDLKAGFILLGDPFVCLRLVGKFQLDAFAQQFGGISQRWRRSDFRFVFGKQIPLTIFGFDFCRPYFLVPIRNHSDGGVNDIQSIQQRRYVPPKRIVVSFTIDSSICAPTAKCSWKHVLT